MKYKSNKVVFVIEGEEYFGKSLASDKLKEAVEEIGFRYIDLKSMYKNFKGPLKDQTERIAYTNQYDGLFLIGSKANDSEKVFSFLFNTENIALAVAQAKEAMQEFNKQHKELQEKLQDIREKIARYNLEIDLYLKYYYVKLIEEFQIVENNLNFKKIKNDYTDQLLNKTERFVSAIEAATWLNQTNFAIVELRNKIEDNTRRRNTIQEILQKIELYNQSKYLIGLADAKIGYQNTLNKLEKLIPLMQSIISINYWTSLENQLFSLKGNLNNIDQSLKDLDNQYHLTTCSHCRGLGVEVIC
jgi:hypothetical protein